MDGHGGAAVAEFCQRSLEDLFTLCALNQTEQALKNLFVELNTKTVNMREGSTISVVCVLESHDEVSVGVLGDSVVTVLDAKDNFHISPEHNVRSNLKERTAAKRRGGTYEDGYIFSADLSHGLQLSRALGDTDLGTILSRKPDIYTVKHPQWILLATDGLIDPGHDASSGPLKEVAEFAKKRATAEELMEWAEKRGLLDNATAIVWKRE